MTGYVKHFGSNETMSFKVTDKKLLKKVHQIIGKSQQFNEYRTVNLSMATLINILRQK